MASHTLEEGWFERPLLYPHRIVVVPLRFRLKSPFFNRGHRIVVLFSSLDFEVSFFQSIFHKSKRTVLYKLPSGFEPTTFLIRVNTASINPQDHGALADFCNSLRSQKILGWQFFFHLTNCQKLQLQYQGRCSTVWQFWTSFSSLGTKFAKLSMYLLCDTIPVWFKVLSCQILLTLPLTPIKLNSLLGFF